MSDLEKLSEAFLDLVETHELLDRQPRRAEEDDARRHSSLLKKLSEIDDGGNSEETIANSL